MNILRSIRIYNGTCPFNNTPADVVTYVVTQGQVNDISCYALVGEHADIRVAHGGHKLTSTGFEASPAFYDFEAEGLHYRR